jgi:hypothetical protein
VRNGGRTQHDDVPAAADRLVQRVFEEIDSCKQNATALLQKSAVRGGVILKMADCSITTIAEAVKPYVDQEQKRHGEDDTLFEDFKDLARVMRLPDEKINKEELRLFLDDEERLTPD